MESKRDLSGRAPGTEPEASGDVAGKIPAPLRNILVEIPRIVVAYSGGLDSRFLCHAAKSLGRDVLAVHARGPHIAPGDSAFARAWADKNGVAYKEIWLDPLDLPEVAVNGRSRCYECKKKLMALVKDATRDWRGVLCDGGNADDLKEYRPGARAVKEAGVKSPLAMAGMGKAEIREAARETGMDLWEQKARPCLLTRFAYGLPPDVKTLNRLARAEAALEKALGEADFRLRLLPRPLLQISTAESPDRGELLKILGREGFPDAEIETAQNPGGYFDRNNGPDSGSSGHCEKRNID